MHGTCSAGHDQITIVGPRRHVRGVRSLRCGMLQPPWGDEASLDSLGP